MSSRRRSLMGKAGVLLGLAEARQVGRGHALPHSQKKRLSDAGELGDGGTVTFPPVSSSSGWMFASPPLWRASAFQGSGSAGSYANCRRLRGVVSLSHAIASLEAGKSPCASPDLMIEVVSPVMALEYQDFLKNAHLSLMNDAESLRQMRATHIKEPA